MKDLELEAFKKFVDAFPYPVWITTVDGLTLYLNKAGFDFWRHPKTIIGTYNFLEEPIVAQMVSLEKLKTVQQGETVFFPQVNSHIKEIKDRWNEIPNIEAAYLDITVFPVMENGKVKYLVTLQVPCKVYKGKTEIERAKEFIENNWLEKYNLGETVKASGLSRAYFTRLFKKKVGMAPHDYYLSVKVKKLKEKLADPNLSVRQAFNACNLEYNGHYADMFKVRVGMTPSEYKSKR